jgi:hypothetical protein
MNDWFETYASALEDRLGRPEPSVHLPREARNPILELARLVAHGTERRNAPLAAYVAARYVAARAADGVELPAALSEAVESAREITPPKPG